MRFAIFATFLALTIAFSNGCASNRQKDEPKPALRALGESVKPGDIVSNRDLGFEIRRRLNDSPADTAGIVVEVDDGKVILRGSAPNLPAAWRAEAAARSVKGVKEVLNQIIVAGSPR
jgi:osmotically-inducible protein OsmY